MIERPEVIIERQIHALKAATKLIAEAEAKIEAALEALEKVDFEGPVGDIAKDIGFVREALTGGREK